MLDIKNLHAGVDGKEILKDLNLSINPGEMHAIMGRNGSGKSTLANVITGREDYNVMKGDILFAGDSILDWSPEARSLAGIFMSFQYPVVIPGVNNTYFLKAALNAKRKHAGKKGLDAAGFLKLIKEKLNDLGYMGITDDIIQIAFGKFKVLADKKKHVYDEDIAELVDDSLIKEDNVINLKSLKVFAGTGEPQRADMTLEVYGEIKKATETGSGPVDAIFKCVKKLYPHDVKLQLYQVHAVTEGTDAQATVSVRIEENGKTTVGQAADTDTLVASANAYLNALNKMIIKRKRTAPEEYEQKKMKGI